MLENGSQWENRLNNVKRTRSNADWNGLEKFSEICLNGRDFL